MTTELADKDDNTSHPQKNAMIEKLEILLDPNNETNEIGELVPFASERLLAAWVLLTRLPQGDLDRVWSRHAEVMEKFARDLLSRPSQTTKCKELFLRLIAQVTSRLSVYPQSIGESLFQAWEESMSLPVHMDLCTSFDVWMESDPEKASELRILERIWKVYLISTAPDSDDQAQTNKSQKEESYCDDEHMKALEYNLMEQTLSSILTDNQEKDDHDPLESWNELVLALFQSHGHQLLPNSLIPSILDTPLPASIVTTKKQATAAWHEWMLSLIQTRITTTPSFGNNYLKDPKMAKSLNKLLMAHVVAPTGDSLRGMAWQTLTAMGETCGWRWCLTQDPTSSALGPGTTLCTWVRLASGELRIQLQQQILDSTAPSYATTGDATTSSFLQASSILPISHSCARILISVVQFCVQLEEQPHRMPISSDSLLHLRQSLEESLWTLVEYLQLNHENTMESADGDQTLDPFISVAIQLFGTLLMEVDIWDLLQKEESPQEILKALACALPMGKNSSNYSILPGLVNIIGDAESDPEKEKLLSIIWDPLFEYLHSYWQDHRHTIDDSIAWACSCTELWSEHEASDPVKKRRLAVLLIDWIQCVLQCVASSALSPQGVQSHMSLVLGCYMTLCKDRTEPPKQHESRVVVRALQLCEQS